MGVLLYLEIEQFKYKYFLYCRRRSDLLKDVQISLGGVGCRLLLVGGMYFLSTVGNGIR